MSHSIELKDCNVVIIANDFNVTIMNNIWLYKNKIFTESELLNSINLPVRVEVRTDYCLLSVDPKKLQFSVDPGTENAKDIIISKIGALVKLLPHTPFSAAGLNFTYFITPDKDDIHGLTKSLFCNQTATLFEGLDEDNIRFGGYFSQDFMGTRFRLDAKPIKLINGDRSEEKIQFAYNFNINLSPENAQENISGLLDKWDMAKRHTETLTDKINK
jgi:hypothetical protein